MGHCRQDRRKSSRPTRRARRRIVLRRFILPAALLGLAMILGCDAVARYRVLSLLFDGVPSPNGVAEKPRKVKGPWDIALDPDDPRAKKILAAAASRPSRGPTVQEMVFVHKPYQQRLCTDCHSAKASFQVPVQTDSCRHCHEKHYAAKWDDWTHGPAALGQCDACHLPHRSPYRGLLKTDVPGLCFSCHDASRVLAAPYHAQSGATRCTTCHDPHRAGNRMLLVDSGSYVRRTPQAEVLPSKHSNWQKDTCTKCHVAEKSNKVLDDVSAVCLSCHKEIQKPVDGRKLHDPIVKGQCIDCHQAHNSPLPRLIKPEAEKNCTGCHKPEEIHTRSHPVIHRADCLLCHTGHSSPVEHLLNPVGAAVLREQAGGGNVIRGKVEGAQP